MPVYAAWRRWVSAGKSSSARGVRQAELVRAIGDFFYAKAKEGMAVSPHTRQRMTRLLELLLAPIDSKRHAEALFDRLTAGAHEMLMADWLLTEGGTSAADDFGGELAPVAATPGASGAAARRVLKRMRVRQQTRPVRTRNRQRGGSRKGGNGKKVDAKEKNKTDASKSDKEKDKSDK